MNKQIFVTFQKEGIHCYPEAGSDPELKSVQFLSHPHRHIFHFRVTIDVTHNNRDIEFIIFKRWLESLYGDNILQLNHKSCEMLGEELVEHISTVYPGRNIQVEISEDHENGAIIAFSI